MRTDQHPWARVARVALLAALSLLPVGTGLAQSPALTWESGSGDEVELWRVGVQGPPRSLGRLGTWTVSLSWEVQVGQWVGRAAPRASRGVWDFGLTPLVRFLPPSRGRWSAFVEGAVGAHLLSRNRVHPRLDMSSAYQFGDHIGAGVRIGAMEIVVRHQHLSNASTVQPNPGANFTMVRVVYYLR